MWAQEFRNFVGYLKQQMLMVSASKNDSSLINNLQNMQCRRAREAGDAVASRSKNFF